MKKENQEIRKNEIRIAAYDLLEKKGYKGTSMLAIAKQSKASNATLYSWYGTKQNLFRTLIEENAEEVVAVINQALHSNTESNKTLTNIGSLLLKLVTSKRAISLNRAAAAEACETGVLGRTLASAGREAIFPLLQRLLISIRDKGEMTFENSEDTASIYLGLLLGDIQIRRVTGAIKTPTNKDIRRQSERATILLFKIFSDSCAN